MSRSEPNKHTVSRRSSAVSRVVRRTLNIRLLALTLIVVSLGGIGLYFFRAYQANQAAGAFLQRAEALEREGKLGQAAGYLRRYLHVHPGDDSVFVRLAETVDHAGKAAPEQKQEAISLYLGALELKGIDAAKKSELCLRAAELLLDVNDPAGARREAEKLLGIIEVPAKEELVVDEENPRARRARALALHALHERGDGLDPSTRETVAEEFKRALALLPGDPRLAVALARIYREQPELLASQERESLTEAARAERADAVVRQMTADARTAETLFESYLYKKAYDLPEADGDLEAALALDPDNIQMLLAAAYSEEREGFGERAKALLLRIMDLDATHPASYLGLARLAVSRDRPDEAIELCRAGLAKLDANDMRRLWLLRLALETRLDQHRRRWVATGAAPSEADQNERRQSEKELEEALDAHAAAIRTLRPLIIAFHEHRPDGGAPKMAVLERSHSLLQARLLVLTGKLSEAQRILEHVASSRGDDREEIAQSVDAFRLLGAIRASRGEWDAAADAFEQAVVLDPTSLPLLLAAGGACGRAQRFDKALSYCGRALDRVDNEPTRAAYARALLQFEASRPAENRDLEQVLRGLERAGTVLAIVESAAGEPGAAVLRDLETAFGQLEGPEGPHATYCRARRLLAVSTSTEDPAFAEARQSAAALEASRPDWPATSLLRGRIAERMGRVDDAVAAYQKALADGGDEPIVVELLLPALSRGGRFEELDELLVQREDWIADSATLAPLAILRHTARGDTEQAVALARRCVERRPNSANERIRLGHVLLADRRADEAEASFKQAVALARDPRERLGALDALFGFYSRTEQPDQARRALRELTEDPTRSASERSLIQAKGAEMLGNAAEAEASLREAIGRNPGDNAVEMALVDLLVRSNDPQRQDEARQRLAGVVERSPEFRPARRALAMLLARRGGDEDWKKAQELLAGAESDVVGKVDEVDAADAEVDQRIEALLLAQRGGPENRAKARAIFEKILAESDAPEVGDRLALARLLDRDGMVDEAQAQYLAAVEGPNPSLGHLVSLVDFLLTHGKAEQAAPWIARFDRAAPVSPAKLQQTARWWFVRGEPDRIEAAVEPMAESLLRQCRNPREQAQVAAGVGEVLWNVERHEAAARWFARAAEGEGAERAHRARYVEILLALDKPAEAAAWFDKLDAGGPVETPEADELRLAALEARVLQAQDKSSEIDAVLEPIGDRAMAASNGDPQQAIRVALAMGGVYGSVGRHEQEAKWFARAVEQDKSLYPALASAWAKQGRLDEAMALCVEAAETDPSTRPATVLASVLLRGAPTEDDWARAEPMLAKALDEHPEDAALRSVVGGVYLVQGKTDEAAALYRGVLESNPNDVTVLNNLATALIETSGGADEALEQIDRAIRLAGPLANLLDTKGTVLLRAGKADEARPWLERAASVPNADPRYQLHLAEACLKQDDLDGARTWFDRAQKGDLTGLALTPGDREAIAALEKALAP